jgi:hypothetical protein
MRVVFAYRPEELIGTVTLHLGRAVAQIIMNISIWLVCSW